MDNKQLLELAKNFHTKKQYWQAKFYFEDYLSQNPRSEYVLEQLGIICEKMTNYEEAMHYFYLGLLINPKKYSFLYRIGYCYECLDNIQNAYNLYKLYIKYNSEDKNLQKFGIGIIHQKRGLWKESARAYEQKLQELLENNSNKEDLRSYLSEIYNRLGTSYQKSYLWEKSALSYEKAIDNAEFITANCCFYAAQSHERAENYKKAQKYYLEAIRRSNDFKDYWYFRLAYVCEKSGDFELANQYYRQTRKRNLAHAVDPNYVLSKTDKQQHFLETYIEYYENLPIDDNIILFESFLATQISCNPFALLIYMLKNNYNFTYVVVVNEQCVIPDELKYRRNVIFILKNSDAYLRHLCTAKYLINNANFPYWFIRREGQFYLNTWHGTPMKTLGLDMIDYLNVEAGTVTQNFLQATHLISPNRFTTDILLDSYGIRNIFSGKIAETGYPRIDLTNNLTNNRKEQIKQILGIENDKPIIFYAPTFRGNSTKGEAFLDLTVLQNDINLLSSDDYNIIFHGHYQIEKLLRDNSSIENLSLVPSGLDSNEILGIADILITDYSSIQYDFISTKKPIINYIYDYEQYKTERGLYFTPEQFPGEICYTAREVKNKILECIKGNIKAKEELINQFASMDDGNACKRVLDFFLSGNQEFVYNYKKKKTNLFYIGPLVPNGITATAINLLTNLNKTNTDYENIVLISVGEINREKQRIDEFEKLPKGLIFIKRTGRLPMLLEEIWVHKKIDESYSFSSESFRETFIKIYQREARRMFGDSLFTNVINFEGYTNLWMRILAQVSAKKKLVYLHNDMYQEWKIRFPSLQGIMNFYNDYDKLVSVSKNSKADNSKNLSPYLNIPKDKFTYLQNTLRIEHITSSSQEDISDNDFLDFKNFSGKKILTIGRLSPEKQHILLLQAFNKICKDKSIRLYIIGQGPLELSIIQEIKKLGLENQVYVLGQKKNPYPYFDKADLFILPSRHEGLPTVLLEAMVLKKPIISTDIPSSRSTLEYGEGKNGHYGVLVENSEEGLISGMEKFLVGEDCGGEFDAKSYNEKAISNFLSLLEK